MSGLGPKDIDVAELYDCFTPVVIIELEDLGFCPKGEGGRFVEGGRIELGGELPVNTHGGLLSHCHPGHPGSLFSVTEAVRQLRGECGPRQVEDGQVALVHGQGGIMSTHCTAILGNEHLRWPRTQSNLFPSRRSRRVRTGKDVNGMNCASSD